MAAILCGQVIEDQSPCPYPLVAPTLPDMSDDLPALPGGVIVRYVPGRDIEIECPGCGGTAAFAPDPASELTRGMAAFLDGHVGCWGPEGRATEATGPA